MKIYSKIQEIFSEDQDFIDEFKELNFHSANRDYYRRSLAIIDQKDTNTSSKIDGESYINYKFKGDINILQSDFCLNLFKLKEFNCSSYITDDSKTAEYEILSEKATHLTKETNEEIINGCNKIAIIFYYQNQEGEKIITKKFIPLTDGQYKKINNFLIGDDEVIIRNNLMIPSEASILRNINVNNIDWSQDVFSDKGFDEKINKAIIELNTLISDEDKIESDVEKYFLDNTFILGFLFSLSSNAKFWPQEKVKKESKSKIDLMITDNHNSFFIEFKNNKDINMINKEYRSGKNQNPVWAVGREQSGAISQISEYSDCLIKKYKDEEEIQINSPKKIIIGWKLDGLTDPQKNSYQHFKNNVMVQIITLTEVKDSLSYFIKIDKKWQ